MDETERAVSYLEEAHPIARALANKDYQDTERMADFIQTEIKRLSS